MWRNTDFNVPANVLPLKVVNGVVYGLIHASAIAIDLVSGITLWEQDFSGQNTSLPNQFYGQSDFYIQSSYVYVKGPSDEFFILRKNNGTVWKIVQDIPSIDDKYTYFEGKLWGAGDGISAIDLSTGEDLLKDYQQIHDDSWRSSITIDPLRRVMYCHDGVYAYCIKIPEL
jgi:glucose dehydrogenase